MIHNGLRRLFPLLRSMKFGITLLLIIMVLSILGTVLPQGFEEQYYSSRYSPVIFITILILGFDNIYNSIIFATLFVMLMINLIMCSVSRFRRIIKKLKFKPTTDNMELLEVENLDSYDSINTTIDKTFRKYGFSTYTQDKLEMETYYSNKNKAGHFGSWFLHFGILLVIICYAYGNITYFSEGVYGVPGTVQNLEGTEYMVQINDFNIEYNQDGSVNQYTSNVDLIDKSGRILNTSNVAVNDPLRFEGYNFYQTGYGWAAKCNVSKTGSNIVQEIIYEQTTLNLSNENIAIYFNRFYPDFEESAGSFSSLSDQLKNPMVLYALLYMGEVVKVNIMPINDVIKWNEYEFVFHSPQRYTYLEVNKMNGQLGAALGAFLIIFGLILVFYYKPLRLLLFVDGIKIYVFRSTTEKSYKIAQKERDIYAK